MSRHTLPSKVEARLNAMARQHETRPSRLLQWTIEAGLAILEAEGLGSLVETRTRTAAPLNVIPVEFQ